MISNHPATGDAFMVMLELGLDMCRPFTNAYQRVAKAHTLDQKWAILGSKTSPTEVLLSSIMKHHVDLGIGEGRSTHISRVRITSSSNTIELQDRFQGVEMAN